MSLKLDINILNELLSDEKLKSELVEYLNKAIDAELEKSDEEMDTDLIDECVQIITAIEEGNINSLTDEVSTNKTIINFAQEKEKVEAAQPKRIAFRARKVLAIAAVVAIVSTISLQVFPGVANDVKSFFNQMVDSLWHTADESATTAEGEKQIMGIDVIFPDDATDEVKSLDEAKALMSKCTFYAYDEDGKQIELAASDCKFNYTQTENEGRQCIIVAVGYRGSAETVTLYIAK
ncbi:MAG: hypothetical protein IJR60_00580 [Eubacterium sp.]|nr:hypothetical protein [Eubacterium sp.]